MSRPAHATTMRDLVRRGYAVPLAPSSSAGYMEDAAGRLFVKAPTGAFVAALAKLGTAPGNNSDPTSAWHNFDGDDGTMTGYSYAANSGWTGTGTGADPYCVANAATATAYVALPDLGTAESKVFTYACWAKVPASSSVKVLMSECSTASSTAHRVYLACRSNATSGYSLTIYDNTGSAYSYALSADGANNGGWHLVGGTCDGSYQQVYVDGVASGSAAAVVGGTVSTNMSTVGVNRYGSGPSLNSPSYGSIAAAFFFPYVLTAQEWTALYHAGPNVLPSPAIASALSYSGLVSIANAGVTDLGAHYVYSRNSATGVYGPVVVAAAEYSAARQAHLAAHWSDPVALFAALSLGDYLIPLGGDTIAYQKSGGEFPFGRDPVGAYTLAAEADIVSETAGRYISFPSAALCTSGDVLCAYRNGDAGLGEDYYGGETYLVRRHSGTWGTPTKLYAKVSTDSQEQSANIVRHSDGRLFLYSRHYDHTLASLARGTIFAAVSENDGATFSDRVAVDQDGAGMYRMTVFGEPACKFVESGDLLYMPAYGRKLSGDTYASCALMQSEDGLAWTLRSWIGVTGGTDEFNETAVIRMADHRLLAVIRTRYVDHRLLVAWSADDGLTWSTPAAAGLYGQAPHLFNHPDNSVILTYRSTSTSVDMRVSRDYGVTWQTASTLRDYTTYGGYTDTVVDADGVLHVLYFADDDSECPWISERTATFQ